MKIGIGILLLFFVTSLQAQNIIGKVIDNKKQPVDGATIVLQAIDSTYINASISNVDGTFVLDSQPEEGLRKSRERVEMSVSFNLIRRIMLWMRSW